MGPPPALMAMLRRASDARDEATQHASRAAAAAATASKYGSYAGGGGGGGRGGGGGGGRGEVTDADADAEDYHSSDDDDATLGRRVRRIEKVVTRLETGIVSMFEKLNARLDTLDSRVDKVLGAHVQAGTGTGRPLRGAGARAEVGVGDGGGAGTPLATPHRAKSPTPWLGSSSFTPIPRLSHRPRLLKQKKLRKK